MDSTLTSAISTLLNAEWQYLYSGGSTAVFGSGVSNGFQASSVLGYAGSAIALFLSLSGAYTTGAKLVQQTEAGFFSFLEDFQNDDRYIDEIDSQENGGEFHDFMNKYANYQFILASLSFWHVYFIIAMGATTSVMIWFKIRTLEGADGTTDITLSYAWLTFLIGCLVGFTNYMAALALTVNKETILKLTGFTPAADTDGETTKEVVETDEGKTTIITATEYNTEEKKNFFAMYDVMNIWGALFFFQQTLKEVLPLAYIAVLEVAVGMVFSLALLSIYFFFPQ